MTTHTHPEAKEAKMTWEDIATVAAQGSSRAFLMLWDRFGRDGALTRTRIARTVLEATESP